MAMKKIYTCDICREEISKDKLFGVYFSGNTDFVLSRPENTDGVHICKRCAVQFYKELKRVKTELFLE